MDDELEFNNAINNGDRVLFVLKDDFEGGVLLGISNVGYHIQSLYRTQVVKTRVTPGDREVLVESLRGLSWFEVKKLAREMGIPEWWSGRKGDLQQDILNRTIAKIEEDSQYPTLTRRSNNGVPMIIPHSRVLKVAGMDEWDEDMTLAPLDWEGVAPVIEEKPSGVVVEGS